MQFSDIRLQACNLWDSDRPTVLVPVRIGLPFHEYGILSVVAKGGKGGRITSQETNESMYLYDMLPQLNIIWFKHRL